MTRKFTINITLGFKGTERDITVPMLTRFIQKKLEQELGCTIKIERAKEWKKPERGRDKVENIDDLIDNVVKFKPKEEGKE